MTSGIGDHIHLQSMFDKVISADEAATLVHNDMTIGMSGFTCAGDYKAVPFVLTRRAAYKPLCITLMTDASPGNDIDKILVEADVIARRPPFQADAILRCKIGIGEVMLIDQHLSEAVEQLRSRQIAPLDVAVIEVIAITENGDIVPATSVGNSVSFAVLARRVTVKANLNMPANSEGLHDTFFPAQRPYRQPIPLIAVEQRIGLSSIPIDPRRIAIIVITGQDDSPSNVLPPDAETNATAGHPNASLAREVHTGHLSLMLQPLQMGIGTVSSAVLHGFIDSPFRDLKMCSEVLQDSSIKLLDSGKLTFASTSSITLSRSTYRRFLSELECCKTRVILRPQEISNRPEMVRRLGLITINTVLKRNIYDNVNSTHVGGTRVMNGIDDLGGFSRNVHPPVFVTKSLAKNGDTSSIALMVSHVNHIGHGVGTIVTEYGLASLRGLALCERAVQIINNCADPRCHELLRGCAVRAQWRGGHTSHLLEEAPAWHVRSRDQGSMASAGLTGGSLFPGPAPSA